jgi:uncharacterized membrane protein YvbJ
METTFCPHCGDQVTKDQNQLKNERNKLIEKILHNPPPTKINYIACGLTIIIFNIINFVFCISTFYDI